MDRLTTRNSEGVAVLKIPYQCDRCGKEIYRLADYGNGEPIEKLARYEELHDRLDKKFNGCISMEELIDSFVEFYDQQEKDEELAEALLIVNDDARKYQEWENLEDQGKLLKLPIAVGDKLYEPRHDRGTITEYIVTNISYFGNNYEIFISWKLNSGIYSNLSGIHANKIGKTVFLTQEEAEAALKEMEGTE